MNYFNSYFVKSRLIKFKTCRKCKKDFPSKNKLHIYLKTYKNKINNINKIVFNLVINDLKNIIFIDNLKIAFAILITKIMIIFINDNEIINNEQKEIEGTIYFINFEYFIIESISKKTSNIKLAFKK